MSAASVLGQLKDFQRQTVDYVFDRLYGADCTRRFLVADEVGLGKTLIARGVAARAVEHLRATVPRIDIVYICSNADIARQNINRLILPGEQHLPIASRLTMLPTHVGELKKNTGRGVNFISLTPSTSLDPRGGLGVARERAVLYCMLQRIWGFGRKMASVHVFRGNVRDPKRFEDLVAEYDAPDKIDAGAQASFAQALAQRDAEDAAAGRATLRARFEELAGVFQAVNSRVSSEDAHDRSALISELRSILAASCVDALEPDLIILDEFQRFSHLLDEQTEAASLARALFAYKDVRVLMLSATPYKMYTLSNGDPNEDHYRDFVRMLQFLEGEKASGDVHALVGGYREALYALARQEPDAEARLASAKGALEDRLRRTMVRTERLAATADRSGMLRAVPVPPGGIESHDYLDYLATSEVASWLGTGDVMELWKSSPFLLNFMQNEYELKRELRDAIEEPDERAEIARTLKASPGCTLPLDKIEGYEAIEARNARMRALVRDTVQQGAWSLLWMPPSLPYYRLAGAYANAADLTKQLVFSSWRVVPRAVAAWLSYEAERQMQAADREARNTAEARKKRKGLLRFTKTEGRLTGMPVLALLYPSQFLAHHGDPVALAADRVEQGMPSVEELLDHARMKIEVGLERLHVSPPTDGAVDERWYWAAPLLLDRQIDPEAAGRWLNQADLAELWAGAEIGDEDEEDEARAEEVDEEDSSDQKLWSEHVAAALELAQRGATALGRMPDDLVDVLARLAVAGPAVSVFRALRRVVGGSLGERLALRNEAARAGWAFRSLFNQPEVMAMLRAGRGDEPYWQIVLSYCVDGCLQAVLDEYVHVLRDSLGLLSQKPEDRANQIVGEIVTALRLRTSRVGIDEVDLGAGGRTVRLAPRNLRTHFALRFTDERQPSDDGSRGDQVRRAFNSPFWPFVLVSTSVGQEGLDFHSYCHSVVHWNLPANPVDLEQREGRVHRYKGHAVRKNVARRFAPDALARVATLDPAAQDPWENVFQAACDARPAGTSDIVPFWVFPTEGGAYIERRVLALPLSRDKERELQLGQWLAAYRMVFGQPRQEDLVEHLLKAIPGERLGEVARMVGIDLSPRATGRPSMRRGTGQATP